MADTADAAADATVTFNVKASSGPKITVSLPLSTTVADLKTKLAEPDMANVPASSQRLIYSGKVLKDNETLATYNVKEGNTMHLVRSAASNQRQNPASQTTSTSAGQTTSAPSPAANIPQNFASGTGNDPLAGLTGARYAGFAGLPSLQELANPPTPEEMMRRLEDPNFAQMMNEALQNPQMIDMMINQNPQLRAMGPQARQMLQSEQFRRMLTNPEAMRGMMDMQRMMGNDPFGGMGGGQEAFPMPGATATTDAQHQPQTQPQTQGHPPSQQPNPFAGMFGGGAGGMNPFGFMPPPPANTDRSVDPSANAQNPQAANPFAALFNPAMFPPQGQQPGQTGANTNADSNLSQQPNPFAANPFLANMQNNPMMQQMMNNPEMMQNAMQMLFGGGAGGAAGSLGGGLGGFGGPPDTRPPDTRPPEERFSTQLRQLNEMGFYSFEQNVQALTRSGGDVNGALEWLFSQPPS